MKFQLIAFIVTSIIASSAPHVFAQNDAAAIVETTLVSNITTTVPVSNVTGSPALNEMTVEELEQMFNRLSDRVIEEAKKAARESTEITGYITLYAAGIGAVIGFIGSMALVKLQDYQIKNRIRNLLITDVKRLRRNLQNNITVCDQLINNQTERSSFITRVNSIVDISERLDDLAAVQEFNFWQTILSSTRMILLKESEIKQIQGLYDLSRIYNSSIESMLALARYHLAYVIFQQQDRRRAADILDDLCHGLLSQHNFLLELVNKTLEELGDP